jgi:hypothetical protein
LSFYRSPNVLGWSKFFVPHQIFIYILCQSQTFCARQKDDLLSVKLVFVPAQRGTKCSQIFGLAEKIWTGTKHFGTCKRTRHLCSQIFGLAQKIWIGTKHGGTCNALSFYRSQDVLCRSKFFKPDQKFGCI